MNTDNEDCLNNILLLLFFTPQIMFIAFDHAYFTAHAHEKLNLIKKKIMIIIITCVYMINTHNIILYTLQIQLTDLLCAITNRLHGKRPKAIMSITTHSQCTTIKYRIILHAFTR